MQFALFVSRFFNTRFTERQQCYFHERERKLLPFHEREPELELK